LFNILFFRNSYYLYERGSLKNNEYGNISQLKTGCIQGFGLSLMPGVLNPHNLLEALDFFAGG
jgi:hypothetical protein